MILRPIDAVQAAQAGSTAKPRPIWQAVEASQKQMNGASECWLITQPAHSALSGEIAAKLAPQVFGEFDEGVIRAIALHDAGWSGSDSELVRASRDGKGDAKRSAVAFLAVSAKEAIAAWTGSVETALKASHVGGFMVSEHFRTIAQLQAKVRPEAAKAMEAFVCQEDARQRKLRAKISLEQSALERLVDGLRFCDLLSLYLCTGLSEEVEFPQKNQQHTMTIRGTEQNTFSLRPSPFSQDELFSYAALRHPRTKTVSSASFLIKITA